MIRSDPDLTRRGVDIGDGKEGVCRQRLCRRPRRRREAIAAEIVRKLSDQVGCELLRRSVIEQFFAWVNRNRRLAKEFEGTIASATACFYAICVKAPARRLFRSVLDSNRTLGEHRGPQRCAAVALVPVRQTRHGSDCSILVRRRPRTGY
jgi:hypothetical protein